MKPVRDWSRLLLLPWQITVWGIDGTSGFGWSIGPLLLGLSPLALINWRKYGQLQQRIISIGTTILLATLFIWAIASQFIYNLTESRYYFPNFMAWALLCAAGYFTIAKITVRGVRLQNLSAAFILLAVGFNTFETLKTVSITNPLPAVIGVESSETYTEHNLGAYEIAMQAIKALPEKSHILMLWETRGFECLPKCDSDEIIDRWRYDWLVHGQSSKIIQAWKTQGYTHVLLNRAGINFIMENDPNGPSPESWHELQITLASLPLVKNIGGIYEIYALP
jgi:hypothetical protein